MRKLIVALGAGMLLLVSAVSASAVSAAKAEVAAAGPTCTTTDNASGPEQEKDQPESSAQNVESQMGTQEGQSGDVNGEHQDTGAAASSNDTNDGEKQVKEDGSTAGDQVQKNDEPVTAAGDSNLQETAECGDQSTNGATATSTGSEHRGTQASTGSTGGTENNRDGE